MWKKLQDNPPFYLYFVQENGYEICVTDYITLYSLCLSKCEFVSAIKESNSKLETTDDELIEKVTNMLSTPENFKDLSIRQNDKCLTLFMCKIYIFPIKLKLTLPEAPKKDFFLKVTQSLLNAIKELQSIEKELRHLLKEKDEEIEKYKEEGAKIRKHWRTANFNEEEYLKKYQVNGAMSTDFPASLLEKNDEKINDSNVKQEPVDLNNLPIKQELLQLDDGLTIPKDEIKQEVKREASPNISINTTRKRQKKLNL